jgi:HSP20 family protein
MFSLIPWRKEKGKPLARRGTNPFALMEREFETLFERMFGRFPALAEEFEMPAWGVEVEETGKEVVVHAEAPGFEPADFVVEVVGNMLHIRAEHKTEIPEKEGEAPKESRYGRFERWFTLPPGVDVEKVEAKYRNGILDVLLPRTPEAVGKRIEVKT